MTSPYAKWSKGSAWQPWGWGLLSTLVVTAIAIATANPNGPIDPSPSATEPSLSIATTSLGVSKPSTAVFARDGVWDATATTDVKTNAYIAAILSAFIYAGNVNTSSDLMQFANAFTTRVASPLGVTRAWYYNGPWDTAWAYLDTPTSHLVVFRGTVLHEFENIETDLESVIIQSFTQFTGSSVQIGSGFGCCFLNNTDLLMPELVSFIASSDRSDKPLWVTGHSLGAALATLFAAYVEQNGMRVQGLYTFGSPYVGLQDWADAYSNSPLGSRTYRYFVDGDPVPLLPPTLPTHPPFTHVGIPQFLEPCNTSHLSFGSEAEGACPTSVNISVPCDTNNLTGTATFGSAVKPRINFNLFECSNDIRWVELLLSNCGLVRINDTGNPSTAQVDALSCYDIADGQAHLHTIPRAETATINLGGIGASKSATLLQHYLAAAAAAVDPIAAAAVDPTAAIGEGNSNEAPMTKLDVDRHSILKSYLPAIYCALTPQQMASVPDIRTLLDGQEFNPVPNKRE